MYKIAKEALEHYHQTLLNSERAQTYLKERGIFSMEAIKALHLGFCDASFTPTLPNRQTKAGLQMRGDLEHMGFLNIHGRETLNVCIVFPVYGEARKIMQVYGRKITKKKRGKSFHQYTNTRYHAFWNLEGIRNQHEVIVCKGITDAMTFYVRGFKNVTVVFGADRFNQDTAKALKALDIKRVYLAFGNDDLGNVGAKVAANHLQHEGIVALRILFPRRMDANDYTKHNRLDDVFSQAALMAESTPSEYVTEEAVSPDLPQPDALEEVIPLAVSEAVETPKESPSSSILKLKGEDIFASFGERDYRVRGLFKNLSIDSMKVNLRACRGDLLFVDNLELYASRQRQTFIKQAASELGFTEPVIKRDLGLLILELEKIQDSKIRQTLNAYEMSVTERNEALSFLKDRHLMTRIAGDLDDSGLVGEEPNKLVGYLAMISRKLPKPLAIVVQSTSAAGKSSLLETLLSFVPPEDCMKYSSITPQSLYYMAEKGIKHKILAVAEGEGASKASYSLKLLQSEGELVISSTGGDSNGISSKEYRVEGPVMIAMTTTAIDIDEELLNRCIVLTVDEGRAQTKAIHDRQRQNQTIEGILQRKKFEATLALHRNAQRLLKPVYVVNPYAPYLSFLDEKTRLRRDHIKYLSLINSVAFLHQYQRPTKMEQVGDQVLEYIEVTLDDIVLANQLANHVLGVTLDELPPQTRRLLEIIHHYVSEGCKAKELPRSEFRFTRKQLRSHSQWGNTQLKVHLKRLVEHEYLVVHTHQRQHFYECLYNGEGSDLKPFLMGLSDIDQLKRTTSHIHRSALVGLGQQKESA